MPTKDKITEEVYLRCKDILGRLLTDTNLLGAGYVIQLVYELAVVVISYENGCDVAVDKFARECVHDFTQLVKTRNTINHNSYDLERVVRSVYAIMESRVVENLYIKIFGEAPGYKIFETECLVYLEYMRRLWGVS